MFQRSGHQEGAERGYNPSRPGRHTHHPLLAVLAEAPLVLHGWLRSGKAGSARGVVPFLQEALALMPAGWKLRTVRADSGFFDQALLGFLEERALPYIIVARMTRTLKGAAAAVKDWTPIDGHYSAASFQLQLHGWSKQRRFVVTRVAKRLHPSASACDHRVASRPKRPGRDPGDTRHRCRVSRAVANHEPRVVRGGEGHNIRRWLSARRLAGNVNSACVHTEVCLQPRNQLCHDWRVAIPVRAAGLSRHILSPA